MDLMLKKNEWTDVYSKSGIPKDSKILIQNTSSTDIRFIESESIPTNIRVGFILKPFSFFVVGGDSMNVYAWSSLDSVIELAVYGG